jgi:myo-inositol-1(or 4)-monophosphatase
MIDERLAFAADLARRAGELLRHGYGKANAIRHKGAVELVTEYDLRSERLITQAIREAYPQDAIRAEESGASGDGELSWWIDPLDGTSNFAHAIPIFTVSIACGHKGRPLLGVVYEPLRDELFQASLGGGATLNGHPIHVSTRPSLDSSLLVTGFPYDVRTNPDNNLREYAAFSTRSLAVRRLGAASLDLAYVAAGRFDGYWEFRLSPWDFAAGILLVTEAGGRVTRADGGEDVFAEPASLLATNGPIHTQMLEVLRAARGDS